MQIFSNQKERLDFLLKILSEEESGRSYLKTTALSEPLSYAEKQKLLRDFVNIRPPETISQEFLDVQNAYLQEELKQKNVTCAENLKHLQENISLWQGDITLLEVDGIVNAANNQMLGCFLPSHACIDNFIHTFAGVQLRQDCYEIMQEQGHLEETGVAKITSAYNLPSKYVLHTVGPIVTGSLTQKDCDLLVSCYEACLELAEENGLKSIAFCCISTGVFMFPNAEAAKIAVDTVKKFQQETQSKMHIVFNVFKDIDYELYKKLLTN